MTLTGTALLVTLGVLSVLAFAGAVWWLPRGGGGRTLLVARRAASLLLVNLLVLLTSGVALNDDYGFFADWTDLRNAITGAPLQITTVHGGGAPARDDAPTGSTTGPSATRTATATLLRDPIAGRPVRYQVHGALSGLDASVVVSLPAGYDDPRERDRRYPVIETFPGYPGSPYEWYTDTTLVSDLHRAVASHAMAAPILISPVMEFPTGADDECVDGPGHDPRVETWLTRDVTAWARASFRIAAARSSWVALGMSAGAWCAAMAAMLHPAQYGGAIVMGGYFQPQFATQYQPFAPSSRRARRYDLIALARHRPPPVDIWLETSLSDPVSYPSSARFIAAARAPLSIRGVVLQHAGHRFGVWDAVLPTALHWLGRTLAGFRAG